MIEGLTDEVLVLVERSSAGLNLAEIYRQSELAETEANVAGAVHRLTSRGDLVKGTDKVYRTPHHVWLEVREQRHAPPQERQPEAEPKPERKAAKKKAVRKKATAKPVAQQGTGSVAGDPDAKSEAIADAVEVTAGENAADERCPGFQLREGEEPLLAGWLHAMALAQTDRRIEAVDAVDAEVDQRLKDLVRSMGYPVADRRPDARVSPAVAELLERASADAKGHLDAYLSELDDPVLDYLIEVASSTKELAEAARAAAGGAE